VVGLLLGLVGIGVLVGAPDTSGRPEALTASVLLALMPITWAIGSILQARELRQGSPLPLVAIGTCAGSLFLLPLAAAQAGEAARWDLSTALAFAYLVLLGSCVGLVLQMWLTRRLRPTTMTLTQVVIPAQALLIGALALGETITWRMVVGAALVIVAVALNAVAGGGPRAEPVAVGSPAD
jgi:drug/metabolite transporter (DMT)-like permease